MIRSDILNDSPLRKKTEERGCFMVYEYEHDVSVNEYSAMMAYFASQMNVRKRQLVARLDKSAVILQAGAMQMMMGAVESTTDLKGAGDFFKKVVGSTVTGETAIKPRFSGTGAVVLEPTYRYVILEDLAEWDGKLIIEDGMFLACEDSIELSVAARNTVSSALLGGEGLFNTRLTGKGIVALESRVPREELITVDLKDDVLKIDGSMAVAWSDGLKFTVERTTKTLIGSAVSKEGLVNVYRGTGRVLIAPVDNMMWDPSWLLPTKAPTKGKG